MITLTMPRVIKHDTWNKLDMPRVVFEKQCCHAYIGHVPYAICLTFAFPMTHNNEASIQ